MKLRKRSSMGSFESSPASGVKRRKHLPAVLYVEDEDSNWKVAVRGLGEKYNLERAKDAFECFAMLQKREYDCILMDIQLSGSELDGIELTRHLRGRFKGSTKNLPRLPQWVNNVPIIFVTAYTARYDRRELLDLAGGNDVLAKPVSFVSLALAMSRFIGRSIQKH